MNDSDPSLISAMAERLTVPRRARLANLIAVLMLIGSALATWWQVERALSGNLLSDFYSFLWPFYGCYVAVVWYRLRRRPPEAAQAAQAAQPASPVADVGDDAELRAYNGYLASRREDALRRRR